MSEGQTPGWDEFRVCPAAPSESNPWIYSIKLTPSFMEKLLRNPHQITLQLETDKRGVFTGSDYEQEANFAPCAKRTEPYECFALDGATRSLQEVGQIQQKIIVPQMHADRSLRQQIHLITEKERREKESSKTGFSGASLARKRGRPVGMQEPPSKATALPDASGAAPLAKSSIERVERRQMDAADLRIHLIKLLARGMCSLREVFGFFEGVPAPALVAMLDQLASRKDGAYRLLAGQLTEADRTNELLSDEDKNNISDILREEEAERELRKRAEEEAAAQPPPRVAQKTPAPVAQKTPAPVAQKTPVSSVAQKTPAPVAQKKPAAQKTLSRPAARSPSPVRRTTAGKSLRALEGVESDATSGGRGSSSSSSKATGSKKSERKTKKRSTKSSVPGASAIPSPPRTSTTKTKRASRKKSASTSTPTPTPEGTAPTGATQRAQLRRLLKENIRQYESKKQEFEENYPEYKRVFDYLEENTRNVQSLGRSWETTPDGPLKQKLARDIQAMHQSKKTEVDDRARKCAALVDKLNGLRGELHTLSEDIKSKYQQLLQAKS